MAFTFDTKSKDFKDMMGMADEMSQEFNIDKGTLLENLLKISFHETAGSYDKSQVQVGGKPGQEGMGLFQFEFGAGQGGHTAINRLIQYYDKKGALPGYIQNLPTARGTSSDPNYLYFSGKQGFDATTLEPSQQYMLMMSDLSQDLRNAKISDISNKSLVDLWLDYHAIPDSSDRAARKKVFEDNMNVFNVASQDSLSQPILQQLINYP